MTSQSPVQRLDRTDRARVVDVLVDAFAAYPVMRYVLGERAAGDRAKLRRLIDFFAMARLLTGEPVLGVDGVGHAGAERLRAVALVSCPGRPREIPPELDALRSELWAELGPEARQRYERFGAAWRRFDSTIPHIHLNMLGVRRSDQGKGLGRLLVEEVARLSREDPESAGVTLTTEDPRNVPFYEHLGFEVLGHATVGPELESWVLFRRD